MSKTLEKLRASAEAHVKAYNDALVKNDLRGTTAAESALKEVEKEYAEERMKEVFAACRAHETPVLQAIKTFGYNVLRHKVEREDGNVVGISLDFAEKQIDLLRFFKFCSLPHLWEYKVEKFNQLVCLRVAKELGLTAAEVKSITDNFYMSEAAKKEELGATPTSNTQMVNLLQKVVDAIIFEAREDGKNKYRVNSHDIAYLCNVYGKRGKDRLKVTAAQPRYMLTIIMDVLYRIVADAKYGVDFKVERKKNNGANAPEKPEQPEQPEQPKQPKQLEQPDLLVPAPEKSAEAPLEDMSTVEVPPMDMTK